MDQKKIRDFVKEAHPHGKILEDKDEERYEGDARAEDVDLSNLSLDAWKKFGKKPGAESARTPERAARSAEGRGSGDARDRFRSRPLTGAGPSRRETASAGGEPRRESGKLSLERVSRGDGASDQDDSRDLIVDEEHGIIGESDSGPEDR
jgi:hypothetical protein